MTNKFIGKTLKDFIDYLNNKSHIYINFYSVSGVGHLSDYSLMYNSTLNRKIKEITPPMGDYVSWIYLEEIVQNSPNYFKDFD